MRTRSLQTSSSASRGAVRESASAAARFQPVSYELPISADESGPSTPPTSERIGRWFPGLEPTGPMRTNAFGIRKIIGPRDDRREVPDPMATPYSGILLLTYRAPNNEFLMGTGWLISPTMAVTAGHVVWDRDRGSNWSTGMRAYQGVRGNVSTAEANVSVASMSCVTGWQQSGFDDCDFAVIRLSRPVSGFTFEFAEFTEADTERMNVNVAGYPSDGGDRMFQHAGQIFDARDTVLYYQMDTKGGQSGCPLILWEDGNDYTAVGIHTAGSSGPYNQGVRIAGPIFHQIKAWRSQG